MSSVSSIKGFADIFAPHSAAYERMEAVARSVFARFGYEEVRTPIVEYTELFHRSIGAETDVVQKEMYTFPDRKARLLTLRPEATAGVLRAYIASGRYGSEAVTKLFTYGPMFRYERPQKGRMRQFHQINCECLGSAAPHTDAESIIMLMSYFAELGIADAQLCINTLGCTQCRPGYRAVLHEYLASLDVAVLCEDCQRRLASNPLRVLDCKVPSCQEHTRNAPRMVEHVCAACVEHFTQVRALLDAAHTAYMLDTRLVRGLDYYCRTTFEVVSGSIGAQSSIAGGGRYDGLVQQLGGAAVPGIGFACGMERVTMLMPSHNPPRPDFFVVTHGDAVRDYAFAVMNMLRQHGCVGDFCHTSVGFKGQMRQADKSRARYCCVIGADEWASQTVMLKNMSNGSQSPVALAELVQAIYPAAFNAATISAKIRA